MFYGCKNLKKIKIFGFEFVEKNKNKCKIIYNNITKEITEYININENDIKKQNIEIKLIDIQNVTNMSYMFYDCYALTSLPDISKWDTKNVTNMSYMFYDCSSLNNLPDISKLDTKNVTNMEGMFSGCKSLNNLPDISKWDTKNVTDMSRMFYGCNDIIIPEKFK